MGIFSVFRKPEILYYPGCVTYFKNKESYDLYKKIFSKLGIDFIESEEKICCGLPLLELGYGSDARKLAKHNFDAFKKQNIKTIVTNCPACYRMFTQIYSELIPNWDIKIENIWGLILEKLNKNPDLIENITNETVMYDDSCYLGRYCGIYDEPRKILETLGYKVEEFFDKREDSICCGGCGSMHLVNPELADEISKKKIIQARRRRIRKIIVCSPEDYVLMSKNAEPGIEIVELAKVLADGLGIESDYNKEQVEEMVGEVNEESGE